ncbi:MAG: IS481 family transposase, partial [Planctomycetota bacterium]
MEANKGWKGEALSSSGRKRPRPVKSIPKRASRPHSYRVELRRRAVQLFVEEQLPAELVAKELGISDKSVYAWVRRYRKEGEAGLQGRVPGPKGSRLPEAVKDKITELKQESPHWGVKRLAQTLKRLFCMKASPKAVRRHLKAVKLPLVKVKRRRKPQPPERRFERSTPNQMWQSDITYYPIQGKMAYIIGFIDDYSRYITGLGLYRSQTSENVVETYRMAVAECGVPKEMLTDNGRQYTTWRGVTKFQRELKKDHIQHIRSATKHPETLGKIERFWQSMKDDFLSRARFETFEEARERLAYWVKYYNHKRPHQGLDGACPADRFFSIEKEMRAVIERGVAANVEEMALHGTPKEPFYMVGRVGGKSVVIETDEKKMSVMLDGQELNAGQAMLYAGTKGVEDEAGRGGRNGDRNSETENEGVQRQGEDSGGAVLVEREAERLGADEGTAGAVGHSERLGEAGADGDTDGAGPEVEAEGGRAALAAGAAGETDGADGEPGAAGRGTGGSTELRKETSHERNGTGKVRSDGKMPGGPGGVDGAEKGLGTMPGDESERFAVLAVAGSGGIGYVGGIGAAGNEG